MPASPNVDRVFRLVDVGDVIDGKYELVRLLGEGGMGAVFEGRHRRLDRRVALKFLHPELTRDHEMVTRLVREAKAAASIGSEHIVDVTDIGETEDGVPFVVMEYLEGEDLAAVLKRETRLDPARACTLVVQACRAIAAAHKRGIVHRDLKPENLFLTTREDGTEWVKVLDFGIAKIKDSVAKEAQRLTETGITLGTPYYMSPEQARGARDLDHLSDVFSMGVILYETLTGKLPFQAATYNEVIIMLATADPSPPSMHREDLDADLEKVVLRALARDRTKRFQSMPELADALRPYAAQIGSLPPAAQEAHLREIALARTALPTPSLSSQQIDGLADTAEADADEDRPAPPTRRPMLFVALAIVVAAGIGIGVLVPRLFGDGEDQAGVTPAGVVSSGVEHEERTHADAGPDSAGSPSPAAAVTADASIGDGGSVADAAVTVEVEADAGTQGSASLVVRVRPRSATIRLDGEVAETNPYTAVLPRDGAEHRIEASADGFTDASSTVVMDQDRTVELDLARSGRHHPSRGGDEAEARPEKQPPTTPQDVRQIEESNPYRQ
jgi:serine/threonine-protein kinase